MTLHRGDRCLTLEFLDLMALFFWSVRTIWCRCLCCQVSAPFAVRLFSMRSLFLIRPKSNGPTPPRQAGRIYAFHKSDHVSPIPEKAVISLTHEDDQRAPHRDGQRSDHTLGFSEIADDMVFDDDNSKGNALLSYEGCIEGSHGSGPFLGHFVRQRALTRISIPVEGRGDHISSPLTAGFKLGAAGLDHLTAPTFRNSTTF